MRGIYSVGHEMALRDKLFTGTPQEPDGSDAVMCDFDFSEQVPIIMAAKNNATGTRRSILRTLVLTQISDTVANLSMQVMIAIDPAYRRSSGGTQLTGVNVPQASRPGWVATDANDRSAELEIWYGTPGAANGVPELVATVPTALTRLYGPWGIQAALGAQFTLDIAGELWIDQVGSFLVYVWTDEPAAADPVAGTFGWSIDFVEELLPT